MIVFGDRADRVEPHAWLSRFRRDLEAIPRFRGTSGYHDRCRLLLIEWGRFHQAALDRPLSGDVALQNE